MLTNEGCPENMRAMKDAIDIIDGKWKLPILIALSAGSKRFTEIAKEVTSISDKMLSKELKDLEINKLVTRIVADESPLTVEYSITSHGQSLEKVMKELYQWGIEHRKEVIGK